MHTKAGYIVFVPNEAWRFCQVRNSAKYPTPGAALTRRLGHRGLATAAMITLFSMAAVATVQTDDLPSSQIKDPEGDQQPLGPEYVDVVESRVVPVGSTLLRFEVKLAQAVPASPETGTQFSWAVTTVCDATAKCGLAPGVPPATIFDFRVQVRFFDPDGAGSSPPAWYRRVRSDLPTEVLLSQEPVPAPPGKTVIADVPRSVFNDYMNAQLNGAVLESFGWNVATRTRFTPTGTLPHDRAPDHGRTLLSFIPGYKVEASLK